MLALRLLRCAGRKSSPTTDANRDDFPFAVRLQREDQLLAHLSARSDDATKTESPL
jgi:hypothetical protein